MNRFAEVGWTTSRTGAKLHPHSPRSTVGRKNVTQAWTADRQQTAAGGSRREGRGLLARPHLYAHELTGTLCGVGAGCVGGILPNICQSVNWDGQVNNEYFQLSNQFIYTRL